MRIRPFAVMVLGLFAAAVFAGAVRGYWALQDRRAGNHLARALQANYSRPRVGMARTMAVTPHGWLVSHVRVGYLGPGNWRVEYLNPKLANFNTGVTLAATREVRFLPQAVQVSTSAQPPAPFDLASGNYQVRHLGRDTIAGRPATVIGLADRASRSLMKVFWVDEETDVILRQDRLDEAGRMVSSTEFLEISIAPVAPPASPGRDAEMPEVPITAGTHMELPELAQRVGFEIALPARVPAGFRLCDSRLFACPCGCEMASAHLRFSDGVQGFSVFEMPQEAAHCKFTDSFMSAADGSVFSPTPALKAVVTRRQGLLIVVIGDLPDSTLKEIARSFKD